MRHIKKLSKIVAFIEKQENFKEFFKNPKDLCKEPCLDMSVIFNERAHWKKLVLPYQMRYLGFTSDSEIKRNTNINVLTRYAEFLTQRIDDLDKEGSEDLAPYINKAYRNVLSQVQGDEGVYKQAFKQKFEKLYKWSCGYENKKTKRSKKDIKKQNSDKKTSLLGNKRNTGDKDKRKKEERVYNEYGANLPDNKHNVFDTNFGLNNNNNETYLGLHHGDNQLFVDEGLFGDDYEDISNTKNLFDLVVGDRDISSNL